MTNNHVLQFFDDFRSKTKQGGQWEFIREERSAIFSSFGHTETYQFIIRLLQERAVAKYSESRERHGVEGLHHDATRIEPLLVYNPKRYSPVGLACHMSDRMHFNSQVSKAKTRVFTDQDQRERDRERERRG